MTEKLFYRDSMIKNFQAEVLSCSPLSEENDINTGINYEVVLDRTAFFPERGGQYADTGVLRLPDTEIRVLDVRERQGVVFHCTDRPAQPKTSFAKAAPMRKCAG